MWAFTCHTFAGVNVLTELAGAAGNASKEHMVLITLRPSLLSTLHF
jgi:orotidine-5'-phosphate decarboxylase